MEINIIKLRSLLNGQNSILDQKSESFINSLELKETIISIKGKDSDLNIFLLETGGTEEEFLKIYSSYKPPYYFLTSGENNSLASSLEIITFLHKQNLNYFVFQGDIEEIKIKLNNLIKVIKAKKDITNNNLGLIGCPSSWLIASSVDHDLAKKKLGINMIDIPMQELIDEINKHTIDNKLFIKFKDKCSDCEPLLGALEIYSGLKRIIKKYSLNGFSIRCFDLLGTIKNTACLALALLNQERITATCEGDEASLISMHIVNKLLSQSSFQCNPSRLNKNDKTMVLAHCTVPFDMCKEYKLTTHFESGIGIGIKGELHQSEITFFKVSTKLDEAIIYKGTINRNLNELNLCRSQIEVKLEVNPEIILLNPHGNHQIALYGDHVDLLNQFVLEVLNS